ncbi:MAG: methylenetetrahydrofolate reductase C-terminal domain-containing protein [Endomicrobium sp.]|jgi:electron transport complex protein RnfC|nr:methylenetetrahydrofolate reductase C-terminal domain-containing protein [Endomicrobium sp.]
MVKKQQNDKMTRNIKCAKGFVNGPCGGFVNGKCEVDSSKNCMWVSIYEKLKVAGKLKDFINQYIAPIHKS